MKQSFAWSSIAIALGVFCALGGAALMLQGGQSFSFGLAGALNGAAILLGVRAYRSAKRRVLGLEARDRRREEAWALAAMWTAAVACAFSQDYPALVVGIWAMIAYYTVTVGERRTVRQR